MQNNNKNVFQKQKEEWKTKKANNRNIGFYSTDALLQQLKHAIDKLETYIDLEHKLKIDYFFLNHTYAKMISDSIMINIFNIVEILDLNEGYAGKIYKFKDLSILENKPLVMWYLIGTYMKHSYKNYLPGDIQYRNIHWKKKYSIVFEHYVRSIVMGVGRDKELGALSGELFKSRLETFQRIYLKWYDYFYVRFFNRDDYIYDIVSKAANNKITTKEEKEKALEFNKAKRKKTKEALDYFTFLRDMLNKEKDLPLYKTAIYKNREHLWELFKNKK